MVEADYAMTEQAMQQQNRFRGDEHLYVQFFTHPVEDRKKSLEEGRPIYRDAEFVQIMVPGDKGNIVMREARPDDIQRFSKQYQVFKTESQELIEGTPLERWGFVTQAQVEELKFFNIRTVEQLAHVSDSHAQKFMGIQRLKQRAKEFIDASAEEAPLLLLQEELAERDQKLEQQSELIEDLQARLAALEED